MELLKREIYSYALAAVNFYGFITLKVLCQMINHYHHTNYQPKDIEPIIDSYINEESFVQKTGRILYQKQIFENTDVREVYEVLKDKPYYFIETSEEMLNYTSASYYELPEDFYVLKDFYSKWIDEDMAYVFAKDALMAFNVDCPVSDIYEMVQARIVDYLNLKNSPKLFDKKSKNLLIIALINLNNSVRKISLRGYSAKEISEMKNFKED